MTEELRISTKEFEKLCNLSGGRVYLADLIKNAEEDKLVLLVSHQLTLTGAPVALVNMAETLVSLGFFPVIISPEDGALRNYLYSRKIPVIIMPSLYVSDFIVKAAPLFQFIVANTIVTGPIVELLNGTQNKLLWWIHEASIAYNDENLKNMPELLFPNILVKTAGPIARERLREQRPSYNAGDLMFSIPELKDGGNRDFSELGNDRKLFALIGTLESRKGQDILLDAISKLPEDVSEKCRFVFIGNDGDELLSEEIHVEASRLPEQIRYYPYIDRSDMRAFYEKTDCLICASREEPTSMTVVEACQLGKTIICSENAGAADFVKEQNAGFVYHDNSPAELADCIAAVVRNTKDVEQMKKNARKVYDLHFSEEHFCSKIKTIVAQILSDTTAVSEREETIAAAYRSRIIDYKKELDYLTKELNIAREDTKAARNDLNAMQDAFFWKITGPARAAVERARSISRGGGSMLLIKKGLVNIRENGIADTARKALHKTANTQNYSKWIQTPLYTEAELNEQKLNKFSREIIFSIIVPLFNTPEEFLREMIESVMSQTYSGWELCLADGSDEDHRYVGKICEEYQKSDKRIRYLKLEKNGGISENTNAGLELAEGDFIALFDHDDILHPAALHEMMRAICDKDADFVYTDEATFESPDRNRIITLHFKPDYAPDNLRANNYICHFTAFSRDLIRKTGGFRSDYDGSQDHDLMLRLTAEAKNIIHIPEVLYFWRSHPQSVAMDIGAKNYAVQAGKNAVKDSLKKQGINCEVDSSRAFPTIYRLRYELTDYPKISIIIPTCDHTEDLRKCLDSVMTKSTYGNFEIILVENNSKNPETFDYYKEITNRWENIKVVKWNDAFNYSAINNYGVKEAAEGEYILLLNNDTEVITPEWMEEMLMYAQRDDVGAVGAMLYYPDDTIQHAGVVLGMGGVAGHVFDHCRRGDVGYMGKLCYAQDMEAVSAACMMIRREVWDCVSGFDERFTVAYNDIDFCMRLHAEGYNVVWTPYAELYHYESRSRGYEDTPEKKARLASEVTRFRVKWGESLAAGDPYYNPNLSLDRSDYSVAGKQRKRF